MPTIFRLVCLHLANLQFEKLTTDYQVCPARWNCLCVWLASFPSPSYCLLTSTGEGDTLHTLPKTAGLVLVDEDRAQDVYNYVSAVSTPMREGKVITKQACYLPSVVGHPGPLIGETRIKGLLVATGHTCWGIQNGPATGKVLSEIIFEGKAKSADLGSLDPREMMGEA